MLQVRVKRPEQVHGQAAPGFRFICADISLLLVPGCIYAHGDVVLDGDGEERGRIDLEIGLASATIATLRWVRAVSCASHALKLGACFALRCITDLAPCTNNLRRY
jgi:hypothetical protein